MKKAIAFGLILGAILSFCNLCFGAETETVTFDKISGLTVNNEGYIVTSSLDLVYFEIEPGYLYTVSPSIGAGYSRYVGFTNEIEEGVQLEHFFELQPGDTYEFNSNVYNYLVFASSSGLVITRTELSGMDGFIDTLVSNINLNGIWDTVLACVPLIAISVLFGFGVWSIARLIIGIVKVRGGF